MRALIKSATILLAFSFFAPQIFAQKEKTETKERKTDDIIIRKKGDTKEKLTIVIDGDKVTVNGKPVDDYKSDDVDIMREDSWDMPGMTALAPMPPKGSWNIMGDDFMREIHSNKAFLGVMTKKADNGAEITEVTKESAAEKAGLKEGDIITKVNDDKIADADDLYKAIGKYKPEDKVNITYMRDGKTATASVALGENKQVRVFSWKNGDGDNDNFNFNYNQGPPGIREWNGMDNFFDKRPRLGIQVQDTEDGKGVKVLEVQDDEPADKAGLKEDDIITAIDGKSIGSVEALKDSMKDKKDGDMVKLDILRDNKAQTINVKLPKDLKTTDL